MFRAPLTVPAVRFTFVFNEPIRVCNVSLYKWYYTQYQYRVYSSMDNATWTLRAEGSGNGGVNGLVTAQLSALGDEDKVLRVDVDIESGYNGEWGFREIDFTQCTKEGT